MNQLCFDDLLPKQQRKQPVKVLKLFELFAGYGSQSLALKRFNIPYESVGYCEIDKYAIKAYKALHGENIPNYGDITKVNVDELPNANFYTYSFPCPDISIAGKQMGLKKGSGTRSSLLWECHRIIEAKRPEYLMMENVKNLVGKQNMPDFQAWLDTLTLLGYNNYWKVVNAKHCGVPQNRERVFCVSIRRDVDDGLFRFEEEFDNGIRLKHILETDVDEKYYLSDKMVECLITHRERHEKKGTGFKLEPRNLDGYASCLRANAALCPTDNTIKVVGYINQDTQASKVMCEDGLFQNLCAGTHGYANGYVKVKEATKQGYAIANEGDSINLEHPKSKTRRGRVGVGVAQTLTTSCNQAVVEPSGIYSNCSSEFQRGALLGLSRCLKANNHDAAVIINNRIRKLTPKECLRLMGLSDHEIEKIQSINISNSQQYKMAGNSIVVDTMMFLKNINGGYE